MSADSPRRGMHKGAQVVSPQPIVDRSIIDSVAGIINDIVPQAYSGAPNTDNKESISWARFEYADVNDSALYPDYNEGSSTPPLLLVLGYATGVQVWLIAATGEATEVLSWRQGVVRTLRVLPSPKTDDEHTDVFEQKRPMVAICDSAGPGPQFCNVSFISLKTGEQTKSIKFKSPVSDILANRRSIVVTFLERIAVFDARTLDDILSITTCYASPGPNPNPVALGTRWLAYSEKKLLPAKRSSGGCEGDGVQSYTATVLYAAKSLGKGLRGLGETVASSLTGNTVPPMSVNNMGNDITQPGVVTIIDLQAAKEEKESDDGNVETVIAHFTAHSDAIVAMTFDLTGALLMTADKRGHDFHVFRIQPHPGGPTLAAVHHLYILHRGDTTAKVQDMVFSSDTRWAAVSTVRGTTHVFPVAPYGGPVGVRTHSTPHVVNRLSRFHRSAGLTDDGTRSHSPVSHAELPLSVYPYSNPRLPPYPHPTILHPLAQIRQPSSLSHTHNQSQTSRPQQRQRLHSDDSGTLPLKICACFAPPRAWIYAQREACSKVTKRAVDSLFIMACHGNMIQYDLEPKPAAGVPKEKVCDDTMIELDVEAKGQWPLLRSPNSMEIVPPLAPSSPLLSAATVPETVQQLDTAEDRWLSQVEIVTHAGPHRRLWMGPQFVFKTYNAPSGVAVNLVEAEAVEIGVTGGSRPARSNPVNMPHAASRPLVPVVIDGSGSSYEQSPRFMEAYGDPLNSENMGVGSGENQLREDLAEAMLETSVPPHRAPGRRSVFERVGQPVTKVVNPLGTVITVSADEEDVSSSQEFDSAEESLPAAGCPRSVCAEPGPADLGELEPDCRTLRERTEICAEMRAASEPAIDNVPAESIREVRESRAICAEMISASDRVVLVADDQDEDATTTTGLSGEELVDVATSGRRPASIDYEREESFRDVPTSLSLCAEPGRIPSSPTTRARERQAVWSGDNGDAHARNLAEAKYVVNCDEESVVLVENRVASRRGKVADKSAGKARTRTERYLVKEQRDSLVVEDVAREKIGRRKNVAVKCEKREQRSTTSQENVDVVVEETTRKARGEEVEKVPEEDESEEVVVEDRIVRETSESFVDVSKVPGPSSHLDKSSRRSLEVGKGKITSTESQASDDFSSIDYQMIESTCCPTTTNSSNHSDDDIEHIHRSELSPPTAAERRPERCELTTSNDDVSPRARRKSSKCSTISDDDLEYINNADLTERSHQVAIGSARLEKQETLPTLRTRRQSKCALSSDDDLEHVQYSDVGEVEGAEKLARKTPESSSSSGSVESGAKGRIARKRKDIVVIDHQEAESEVTVIVEPGDRRTWTARTTEVGESETCPETRTSKSNDEDVANGSPTRKPKARSPKRSSSAIEIIDIDAMQKAEMRRGNVPDVGTVQSEWKVLSPRYESRTKKLRKCRRGATDVVAGDEPATSSKSPRARMAELQEAAEELLVDSKWQGERPETTTTTTTTTSWSAIVKKKQSAGEGETRRESDLETLLEVEEKGTNCQEVKSGLEEQVPPGPNFDEPKPIDLEESSRLLEDDSPDDVVVEDSSQVQEQPNLAKETFASEKRRRSAGQRRDDDEVERRQEAPDVVHETTTTTTTTSSSKENSPEPADREVESEKRSDSDQEIPPERSSSSDELNANNLAVREHHPDRATVRDEQIDRNATSTVAGNAAPGKKGNRFKKKKRR